MPGTDLEDVFVEQPTSDTAVVVFKGEHDLAQGLTRTPARQT